MNIENIFKLILIFVLICGIIGCYTKKDIEKYGPLESALVYEDTNNDGEWSYGEERATTSDKTREIEGASAEAAGRAAAKSSTVALGAAAVAAVGEALQNTGDCGTNEKKITGPDGKFLCFPNNKVGAYNVNISNEGNLLVPPYKKIEGKNCSPNCKSCGFSDDPTGESDCIYCRDSYHHYQEHNDGTGSCHKEKIGHDNCSKKKEKEIYLDNYQKTKLCFNKKFKGAFNHNSKYFFKAVDSSGIQIKCDESCKSCGFSDNPSGKRDCIICKDGFNFTPEWPDGTGSCSSKPKPTPVEPTPVEPTPVKPTLVEPTPVKPKLVKPTTPEQASEPTTKPALTPKRVCKDGHGWFAGKYDGVNKFEIKKDKDDICKEDLKIDTKEECENIGITNGLLITNRGISKNLNKWPSGCINYSSYVFWNNNTEDKNRKNFKRICRIKECLKCPKNFYSDSVTNKCLPCKDGKITDKEGSTSPDDCKKPSCAPGKYYDNQKEKCIECKGNYVCDGVSKMKFCLNKKGNNCEDAENTCGNGYGLVPTAFTTGCGFPDNPFPNTQKITDEDTCLKSGALMNKKLKLMKKKEIKNIRWDSTYNVCKADGGGKLGYTPICLITENDNICRRCPDGYYNDKVGVKSMCKPCPVGTYNDKLGQSGCKKCDIGTYSNQEGRNKRCLTNGCWSIINDLDEQKCQQEYDNNQDVMWIKDGLVTSKGGKLYFPEKLKNDIDIMDRNDLQASSKNGKCLGYSKVKSTHKSANECVNYSLGDWGRYTNAGYFYVQNHNNKCAEGMKTNANRTDCVPK